MTTALPIEQELEEITGTRWIVDYSTEPPTRLVDVTLDRDTLLAIVDAAAHAKYAPMATSHTVENADVIIDYFQRVARQLERRSLHDYLQWTATKHLDDEDADIDLAIERGSE